MVSKAKTLARKIARANKAAQRDFAQGAHARGSRRAKRAKRKAVR